MDRLHGYCCENVTISYQCAVQPVGEMMSERQSPSTTILARV